MCKNRAHVNLIGGRGLSETSKVLTFIVVIKTFDQELDSGKF